VELIRHAALHFQHLKKRRFKKDLLASIKPNGFTTPIFMFFGDGKRTVKRIYWCAVVIPLVGGQIGCPGKDMTKSASFNHSGH